jgi:hypothetical protein
VVTKREIVLCWDFGFWIIGLGFWFFLDGFEDSFA